MKKVAKGKDTIAFIIRTDKKIIDAIDHFRIRSGHSRCGWVVSSILDKLERLGCDLEKIFEKNSKDKQ